MPTPSQNAKEDRDAVGSAALALALGLLLGTLAACAQTQRSAAPQDAGSERIAATTSPGLEAIDAILLQGIADKLYPGAVCVVGRVDPQTQTHETLYAQAFGFKTYAPDGAHRHDASPVSLNTVYDLASVTKLVATTSAALIAIAEGRLDLDTPVATYLPDFAQHGKEAITVRHLMTHTSGLPAYENPANVEPHRAADQHPSDALVAHYAALRPLAPPGTRYTYSCINFQILARLVEIAYDQPLEAVLQTRLLRPLGMRDTTWRLTPSQLEHAAPTHRDAAGQPVAGIVHDPLARYHQSAPHCPGNAGLYSTAPDLARWCRLILQRGRWGGQQRLDADLLAQATSLQTDPAIVGEQRGLGFDLYESDHYVGGYNALPGHHLVGHSGYTGTLVLIDQHTGVYMVLLTNRTFPADPGATDQSPSINAVRRACWGVVRGRLAPDESAP